MKCALIPQPLSQPLGFLTGLNLGSHPQHTGKANSKRPCSLSHFNVETAEEFPD